MVRQVTTFFANKFVVNYTECHEWFHVILALGGLRLLGLLRLIIPLEIIEIVLNSESIQILVGISTLPLSIILGVILMPFALL